MTIVENKIKEALLKLDHNNDDHWTNDGLPKISTVVELIPEIKFLKRKEITDAFPEFKRAVVQTPIKEEEEVPQEDPLAKIAEALTPLETEIALKKVKAAELALEITKLQEKIEVLLVEQDKLQLKDPYANQKAIMEWAASQRKLRERRTARSPLDLSYAARRKPYPRFT